PSPVRPRPRRAIGFGHTVHASLGPLWIACGWWTAATLVLPRSERRLELAPEIIAGDPAEGLLIRRLVIIEHRVDSTLLPHRK
ncbi:hypothetical protein L2E47_46210, partial [Pseudomonas aeruginosa]|nr:hypothetical protein [Pseudomonas aeruginosa]